MSDYGLVTQKGEKKPVWHVHRFFDQLVRDSEGLAVVANGSWRLLVARSRGDTPTFRMLFWDGAPEPRVAAAETLLRAIPQTELAATYGTQKALLAAVGAGRSADGKRDREFADAKAAYENAEAQAGGRGRYVLKLAGLPESARLAAESVKVAHRARDVQRVGDTITFDLERNEVLFLATE